MAVCYDKVKQPLSPKFGMRSHIVRPVARRKNVGINTMSYKCPSCGEKDRLIETLTSDKESGNAQLRKDYVVAIKYINSCHSILNRFITENNSSKPKAEQINMHLPDIPNFLTMFNSLYNVNYDDSIKLLVKEMNSSQMRLRSSTSSQTQHCVSNPSVVDIYTETDDEEKDTDNVKATEPRTPADAKFNARLIKQSTIGSDYEMETDNDKISKQYPDKKTDKPQRKKIGSANNKFKNCSSSECFKEKMSHLPSVKRNKKVSIPEEQKRCSSSRSAKRPLDQDSDNSTSSVTNKTLGNRKMGGDFDYNQLTTEDIDKYASELLETAVRNCTSKTLSGEECNTKACTKKVSFVENMPFQEEVLNNQQNFYENANTNNSKTQNSQIPNKTTKFSSVEPNDVTNEASAWINCLLSAQVNNIITTCATNLVSNCQNSLKKELLENKPNDMLANLVKFNTIMNAQNKFLNVPRSTTPNRQSFRKTTTSCAMNQKYANRPASVDSTRERYQRHETVREAPFKNYTKGHNNAQENMPIRDSIGKSQNLKNSDSIILSDRETQNDNFDTEFIPSDSDTEIDKNRIKIIRKKKSKTRDGDSVNTNHPKYYSDSGYMSFDEPKNIQRSHPFKLNQRSIHMLDQKMISTIGLFTQDGDVSPMALQLLEREKIQKARDKRNKVFRLPRTCEGNDGDEKALHSKLIPSTKSSESDTYVSTDSSDIKSDVEYYEEDNKRDVKLSQQSERHQLGY